MHTSVLYVRKYKGDKTMPVADNKHPNIDSNSSRSAQNGGSGQQKHGSGRRGGSNKRSGSKSMVSKVYLISIKI